ncbi:MAG TPA: metallophosphoesterase [Bacillota bacterium]
MRILVVSDSHGDFSSLKKVYNRENEDKGLDLVIHLGDGVLDALRLQQISQLPLEAVNGNNDPKKAFPEELCIKLDGIRVFCCHGHTFNLPSGLKTISSFARRTKSDLAFFGHTHQHFIQKKKGLTLINPGAICRWEKDPGYILLEIEAGRYRLIRNPL